MPISSGSNKKPIMDLFRKFNIRCILELGVGYGHFGPKIKIELPGSRLFGIEIFKPYFEKIPKNCYERLFHHDIRTFDYEKQLSDVKLQAVMIIDVLEHLKRDEGIKLLEKINFIPFIIICVPIIDYEQGEMFDNVHEAHLTQWKVNELEDLGFTTYFTDEIIGVFYKNKS